MEMVEGYRVLSQDKADDTVVAFYHEQENTHYCHMLNQERYEAILRQKFLSGDFHQRIATLLGETKQRLEEIDSILMATKPQLPSEERIEASLMRLFSNGMPTKDNE